MKLKWYLQTWFICILAALWPLYGIPTAVAIILIVLQGMFISSISKKYGEIDAVDQYVKSNNEAAETLISNATKESDDLITDAIRKAEDLRYIANKEIETLRKTAQSSIDELNSTIKKLKAEEANLIANIEKLDNDIIVDSVNLSLYENLSSEECKDKLAVLRMQQSDLIKNGKALVIKSEDSKKVLNNNIKQLIRCFNSECSFIIDNVSVKNIDTSRGKIQKSFEVLNNIFSTDGVALSHDYLAKKLEELNLVYAYELKKEQERELQKAIREQMVEEEKVRKEIEREKAKIVKEETQFKNEISKLMAYMQKSTDEIQSQLYIEKIKELEIKLQLLEKDKENVLQREQNTRAGFVYVISNIGSFGENVYKIGMTRRLEPMDRIKELSDASVPFPFDVHALIFSEDAPALENIMHQTFRSKEVNKVNSRKEFFNVPLENIKNIVKNNYNATVNWTETAAAIEYRESLQMERQASA